MRRRIGWATAWLAGAAIAAVVIAVTVSQLGSDLFGASSVVPVLSQAAVHRQLSTAQAEADQATQPGQQPSSPAPGRGHGHQAGGNAPVSQSWSYQGGMVHASCRGSLARLTAVANPTFDLNGLVSGPATTVSVRFESGSAHTEQTVTVTCPNGAPAAHSSTAHNDTGDDHGGGGGGGGGGGPGGGHGGGGDG
jgi:uncharacterized membrane protein YgcG